MRPGKGVPTRASHRGESIYSFDGNQTVSRLFVYEGNILALTLQEPFFSYIDIDRKCLIRSFGRQGRAGGELPRSPQGVNLREGRLQFFDFVSKSLISISVPEGVVDAIPVPYDVDFRPLRMVEIEGKKIATGGFDSGSVAFVDSDRRIVKGESYPFDTGTLSGIERGASIQSDIVSAPDSAILLIRTLASDCFEIYRVNETGIRRVFVNEFKNPPVIERNRINPAISRAGYIRSSVDNENIYLMYSESSYRDASNEGLLSDRIHIYDWDGNLIRILHLPEKVGAFCVKGTSLFAVIELGDHSEIVEYEMESDSGHGCGRSCSR